MRGSTIAERMGVTKSERRRLWDFECGLCSQKLARETCSAIWAPRCTEEQMRDRRRRCLAAPRGRRGRAWPLTLEREG